MRLIPQTMLIHLGAVVTIGTLLGFVRAGIGSDLSLVGSLAFWLSATALTWCCFAAGSWLAARLLAPWHLRPSVAWLVGAVAGSVAARPLIFSLAIAFQPLLNIHREIRPLAGLTLDTDNLSHWLEAWGGALVAWMAVNAIALVTVGRPSSAGPLLTQTGSSSTSASDRATAVYSGLLCKLPKNLGSEIAALRSDDHYLHVFTRNGTAKILYRLTDAIAELEATGMRGIRVHRSYWVAEQEVAGIETGRRRGQIVLRDGTRFPVSERYIAMVEERFQKLPSRSDKSR